MSTPCSPLLYQINLGLVMLLVITEFAWIALVFPLWVLLVSTYIFASEFQRER